MQGLGKQVGGCIGEGKEGNKRILVRGARPREGTLRRESAIRRGLKIKKGIMVYIM